MSTMSGTDRRQWAKEEIADAIVVFYADKTKHDQSLDFDDRESLRIQANRAIAALGLIDKLIKD